MAVTVDSFAKRKIAVMGLARSGMAAVRALLAGGAKVIAWDDSEARRAEAEKLGARIAEPVTKKVLDGVAALVLSPGIPHTHPRPHKAAAKAKALGIPIIGDVELLFLACPHARFIGITGTNGKSTTTALITHVLRSAGRKVEMGGNIGRSALDLEPLGPEGIYVIEMSSYQLELTPSAAFDAAILTNITPDHLDRHGGMAGYIAAKKRIFANQTAGCVAVVGVDTPEAAALAQEITGGPAMLVPISALRSQQSGVAVVDHRILDQAFGAGAIISLPQLPSLPGNHNMENAAATYAVCRAMGLAIDDIVQGLKTFPGLEHRQQLCAVLDGIPFINDSKATNPDATAKALSSYTNIFWIAGGKPKDGGFGLLDPYLGNVTRAILIGEAADALQAWIAGRLPVTRAADIAEAVSQSLTLAKREGGRGPVVLLSPACASFDQFSDFEARGRAFARAVAALPASVRDIRWRGEEVTA